MVLCRDCRDRWDRCIFHSNLRKYTFYCQRCRKSETFEHRVDPRLFLFITTLMNAHHRSRDLLDHLRLPLRIQSDMEIWTQRCDKFVTKGRLNFKREGFRSSWGYWGLKCWQYWSVVCWVLLLRRVEVVRYKDRSWECCWSDVGVYLHMFWFISIARC